MRFVLFYGAVESFNYFTDQITAELRKRGHEVFILDYNNLLTKGEGSLENFNKYANGDIDGVICFDRIGIVDDIYQQLWDEKGAVVCNILMDHPMRFPKTMKNPPKKYIQFCCDRNHVTYTKDYYGDTVNCVEFMPHAGTQSDNADIPWEERKYDVLFSGTYYNPMERFMEITDIAEEGSTLFSIYQMIAKDLLENSTHTLEEAINCVAGNLNFNLSDNLFRQITNGAEPVDWMIRMYYREKVVKVLAEAGIEIWLLGRGWENHESVSLSNVHHIKDRVPFDETFQYMSNAKINLNVMPWFKDGSHDRIFNSFLRHSLPLTDPSKWMEENYKNNKDIIYYNLNEIEKIPEIVNKILSEPQKSKKIIENGYGITKMYFTWKNCVDQILEAVLKMC